MAGEIKVAGLKKLLVRLRKTEKRGQDFSEVFRYKIDPEISRALAEYLATSFSVATRTELDVRDANDQLVTLVIYE